MKPNLKELNLEKLKKIAAKTPRIRVKLTRKHWIFIGCAPFLCVYFKWYRRYRYSKRLFCYHHDFP